MERQGVKRYNKIKGRRGERRAARYLKRRGYKIVCRNFKCPFGEVDIIARKGEVLAFTEVKTRLSDSFGAPSEAVNAARRRRYIQSARFYFAGREPDCVVRFDIIEVTEEGVNHIENAFES